MSLSIKIHDGYFYTGKQPLIENSDGAVIRARSNATYEIAQGANQPAPNRVYLQKQGNNLKVSTYASEEASEQTGFTIADYFLYPESQLVGLGGDGLYYTYLPIQSEYEAFFGKDIWLGNGFNNGASQQIAYPSALAGEGKITPWLLEAQTEPMASYILPVLGGIGASAVLLAAIESTGSDSDSDDNANQEQPNPEDVPETPKADINEAGTQILGTATAGLKIVIKSGAEELGHTKADDDGNFSFDLEKPLVNGELISVSAVKDNTPSEPALVTAPDTVAPESVKSATINDDGTQVSGTAAAGDIIEVRDEFGNILGQGKTAVDGSFALQLTAAQAGEQMLSVVAVDAAQNASEPFALTGASGKNGAISLIVDIDRAANTVAESAEIGAAVGITAKASDYEAITYSLLNDFNGTFTMDSATGVITTAGTLDFEVASSYSLGVRAASADGSFRETEFDLAVTNVNDNEVGKLVDANDAANEIAVSAMLGSSVGIQATATDADGDIVTFSLADSADGLFGINTETGEVVVAGALDGQVGKESIAVVATSSDGSTSEASFTVNITAADTNAQTTQDAQPTARALPEISADLSIITDTWI